MDCGAAIRNIAVDQCFQGACGRTVLHLGLPTVLGPQHYGKLCMRGIGNIASQYSASKQINNTNFQKYVGLNGTWHVPIVAIMKIGDHIIFSGTVFLVLRTVAWQSSEFGFEYKEATKVKSQKDNVLKDWLESRIQGEWGDPFNEGFTQDKEPMRTHQYLQSGNDKFHRLKYVNRMAQNSIEYCILPFCSSRSTNLLSGSHVKRT